MATQKLRRKKNFTPCVAVEDEEIYNLESTPKSGFL
jgi:hypothetical protein